MQHTFFFIIVTTDSILDFCEVHRHYTSIIKEVYDFKIHDKNVKLFLGFVIIFGKFGTENKMLENFILNNILLYFSKLTSFC